MQTSRDEDKPVDVYKFKSQITLDSSFGCRPVAKRASSEMRLYFFKDGTGAIEWDVPKYDLHEFIGLTFEYAVDGKRKLTEYDGIFAIPDQAMDLLEKNGVDCAEMRNAMNQ
jgi:hypothetical protein